MRESVRLHVCESARESVRARDGERESKSEIESEREPQCAVPRRYSGHLHVQVIVGGSKLGESQSADTTMTQCLAETNAALAMAEDNNTELQAKLSALTREQVRTMVAATWQGSLCFLQRKIVASVCLAAVDAVGGACTSLLIYALCCGLS